MAIHMRDMIVLDLHRASDGKAHGEWLRTLITRAMTALRSIVSAFDDPEDVPLLAEIDQLMARLADDNGPDRPEQIGNECVQRCEVVAERIRRRRAERRREMTTIVTLVRDAVSAVESEMTSLHSSIEQSTDRFEAIAKIEDPAVLRQLLVTQVAVLKKVTADRRAAWEARQRQFQDQMDHLEQQLIASKREASLDALTGAANRGSFDRECQARIQTANSRFVLAMLDMDNLKQINDTHGHAVGDRALIALARGLRRNLRDDDFIARLGGDEFAVLANNLSLRQAEIRFGATIARVFATQEGDEPLACVPTVSCGLAEFSAGDTFASLYERADGALYAAKRIGKNRVAIKERAYLRDLIRR